MKKETRNLLIGAGAAAAGIGAAVTISHKLTKELIRIAMDREMPKTNNKSKRKLTGTKKDTADYEMALSKASEMLENSGCEQVEIISHDGLKLVGHYHNCENPKRVIIAMHGWRSKWSNDFCAISDFWHNNDCCVLYAEQRGQGNSDGDYIGFGLMERYDCLDWINWINSNITDELPIYLCGVSMGATTVLMTAGLELPKNVRGIIADCGFTSPHAIWKHVVENNLHMPYDGIRSNIINKMCKKKINIGAKDYSATDAMKKCEIPVLFIHGTDDCFVPVEMTYENYKACAAPKRLLVVPGAEHAMSYFVNKTEYENKVTEFWKDFDIDEQFLQN